MKKLLISLPAITSQSLRATERCAVGWARTRNLVTASQNESWMPGETDWALAGED